MFRELCYYLDLPLCVDDERFVYTQLGFISMHVKISSSASSVMAQGGRHYVSVCEIEQLVCDSGSVEHFVSYIYVTYIEAFDDLSDDSDNSVPT
jgi:hypothetical protein